MGNQNQKPKAPKPSLPFPTSRQDERRIQNLARGFHQGSFGGAQESRGKQRNQDNPGLTPMSVLKENLRELLTEIARTGEATAYSWVLLKNYFVIAIKDALIYVNTKYPDCSNKLGEQFNDVLQDLIDLFLLFDDVPPFTTQRIAEVLLEPEKYYKSSRKYCYALERLLNISPIF